MKISIQNLKQGISEYSETIFPDFIDKDYKDYYPNDFVVDVLLDMIDKDMRVKVKVKTETIFTCNRCLKNFKEGIDLQQEQIYNTSSVSGITDEDTVNLPIDAVELDLTNLLNEMVLINHPIKMLCKDDCKGLCVNCGIDLNENKCQCADTKADPRWEKLRKLIK